MSYEMQYKQKYLKIKQLVKQVNKQRKKQAQQIDILCQDMVSIQRDFIKTLEIIDFSANFYKTILGITDLKRLLETAGNLIEEDISESTVSFFLRDENNFKMFLCNNNSDHKENSTFEKDYLENCFTYEIVENVCLNNKICSLETLFTLGLQGSPAQLSQLSAITIPLHFFNTSAGFILITKSADKRLSSEQISRISGISTGLTQAVKKCQTLLCS
jgi:hypothetical protein